MGSVKKRPVVQALLVADQIYIDRESGKKIIAGTFHNIWALSFPARFARNIFAFVSLTEVDGDADVRLRYVDLSDGKTLLETRSISVHAADPLATFDLILEIEPLPMPHEGVYALELLVDGDPLGGLRITAGRIEARPTPPTEGEA